MRTPGIVAALILTALSASAASVPHTRSAIQQAPAAETGFLSVTSDPVATLTIDGKDFGKTPAAKIELPVGAHQLSLVSLDGKLKRSLGVKIAKGETTRIKVNLGP